MTSRREHPTSSAATPPWQAVAADWAADKEAFQQVPWGKAMMWIFLLSDTFVFTCFLTGYMAVRMTTTEPWPNTSEVFALTIAGQSIPLILIAIMTFVLISSSGKFVPAISSAKTSLAFCQGTVVDARAVM
jgi:cytochrome c oxidase subunit III